MTAEKRLQMGTWLKHFFVYGFGVILMNAISFIFIPLYTRSISTVDFGVLELFNRSQDVLLLIMSFGFRAAVLTLYQMESDEKNKQALYSTAIQFLFFTGIVVFAITLNSAGYLSDALFGTTTRTLEVQIMIAATFAESMFQIAALYLQSALQSVLYMSVFVSRAVFSVLLNLLLVYHWKWGLRGILIAMLLHTGLYALFVTAHVIYKTGLRFDLKRLESLLRFGLPLVPGAMAMFFLNNGDRYFLNIYSTKSEIGVYGLAYKIGTIILTIVLYPFGKIWSVTMVDLGKGEKGPKALGAVATYLMIVSVFFTLGLSLLSPYLLRLVTTEPYWAAAKLIPIIAAAYIFYSLGTVMDASFYLTKRTLSKPVILGLSFALIFALYRLLIPKYGSLGAAWATLGGFIGYALITFVLAQRVFRIAYEMKRLAFTLCLGTALLLIGNYVPSEVGLQGLGWRLLLIALFPVTLFAIPFFHAEELFTIRNSIKTVRGMLGRKEKAVAAPAL